ncbi:gliding motility-associated C-terminal domain-containing protein [Bacteroidales bacterium OttesenSCG-928-B11]|nr:gliding motility-associated C-terminal domain-containing protein [Bacteroidales bacterium OttesenSCG-928-E04]MDL2312481.1 gliding motility-associated C-terminal domain-containing protein [Bacteroidales bacterium OttesenSCG-928-B11]
MKYTCFLLPLFIFSLLLLPAVAFSQGQKVYWSDAATSNVLGNTSNWRYGSPHADATHTPMAGIALADTLVFVAGLNSYSTIGKILANQNELHVATILIEEPGLTLGTTTNIISLSKDFTITKPLTIGAPLAIESSLFVEDSLIATAAWTIGGDVVINVAATQWGGDVNITGDLTVNDKFIKTDTYQYYLYCYNLTVNDTMTCYYAYINKNLEVNGWVSINSICLQGNENATIHINPLQTSHTYNLFTSKNYTDTVTLLSDINMPTSMFQISNCAFFSQGNNIFLSTLYTDGYAVKDFSISNITLENKVTFSGINNTLDRSYITTPRIEITAWENSSIGTVHLKSNESCLYYSTPLYSDSISKLVLESPALGIWTYDQVKPAIYIKDSLIFLQSASIVAKNIDVLAIKNIKDYGLGCVKSSVSSISLDTIPPLTLYLTQTSLATSNLNFMNIQFAGGNWTADKVNDLGLNTGNITWNGSYTPGRAFYWVGNSGNTNDPTHWAFSSGGTPQNASGCLPSVTDTVYIDHNSCTMDWQEIHVNTPLACAAFYMTDINRRSHLISGGTYQLSSIAVRGNVNLSGLNDHGMNSINLLLLGSLGGQDTLFTNGVPVFNQNAIVSFISTGTYDMIGDIKPISAYLGFVEHKSGLLRTNGYNITTSYFNSCSSNNAQRSLDVRNSIIQVDGNKCYYWRFHEYYGHRIFPSGFHVDGSALHVNYWNFEYSEIKHINSIYETGGIFMDSENPCVFSNCTGRNFYNFTTTGGDKDYCHVINGNGTSDAANPVRFNKVKILEDTRFQTHNLRQSFAFQTDTLQIKMGKRLHLFESSNDTTQVDSLFELIDIHPCNILTTYLNDYSYGGVTNLKLQNKTMLQHVSTTHLHVVTSGDSLLMNNGIDGGQNTGKIKFDTMPEPSKVFYWVGDAGHWTDGSHWSIGISGGDPLITNPDSCLPAAMDSVVFDANSFSLPDQQVDLDKEFHIHALTWTPDVNNFTPTFYVYTNLYLTGCLEWASDMRLLSHDYICIYFQNQKGTSVQKIKSNGTVFFGDHGCYTFDGTGRYVLLDDIAVAVAQNLYYYSYYNPTININSGNFQANQHNLIATFINIQSLDTVNISGSDIIFVRDATINSFGSLITDSNTNLLNGNYDEDANLYIYNYGQSPLDFGIIQRADSSITAGRLAASHYSTHPVHARKYITQSSNNTFDGLWEVDTLEFIYSGDVQKQATLYANSTKIIINKALMPHSTPCQSLLMQSSDQTQYAQLRLPNCDTLRYVNLKKIEADTAGLFCHPTILEPRTEANPNAEHPNFNTIITPPVSLYRDTILNCESLSYLYQPMDEKQASYIWGFGAIEQDTVFQSALTDYFCYVDSVGIYKAIIDFTPTYGECQYVYQLKVLEILDTVKPEILASDFTINIIDSCYWIADSTLDAVFSDCFLNEYWYSLTGTTSILRVDSTLAGVRFNAGITTVTVHARDSIPPTYYSSTTNPIPQSNYNTFVFTVTVIDTTQRFSLAPFDTCSSNVVIDLRDYVSDVSVNDTVLFFSDNGLSQPITSLDFSIQNRQAVYLYAIDTLTDCRGQVVQLDLMLNRNYITPINKVICSGSSYNFFGTAINSVGTYFHTLQSIHGCDSVIELSLAFSDLLTDTINAAICEGETYNLNGFNESQEGTYQQKTQTVDGCDSITTLFLSVNPSTSMVIHDTICEGEIYNFFGQNLRDEGVYSHSLSDQYGCDSIVELHLVAMPVFTTNIAASICEDASYLFAGNELTEEGVYYNSLLSSHGCDSTIILTLSIEKIPDFEIIEIGVLCEDAQIELNAKIDNVSYQWSTGDTSQSIFVSDEGLYSVTINTGQCQAYQEIEVFCPCKLSVPNVFTPNYDGYNDEFMPQADFELKYFHMIIYDRWGKEVFRTNTFASWNGEVNGRNAPTGVYYHTIEYYSIEHPDRKCVIHGSITLIR